MANCGLQPVRPERLLPKNGENPLHTVYREYDLEKELSYDTRTHRRDHPDRMCISPEMMTVYWGHSPPVEYRGMNHVWEMARAAFDQRPAREGRVLAQAGNLRRDRPPEASAVREWRSSFGPAERNVTFRESVPLPSARCFWILRRGDRFHQANTVRLHHSSYWPWPRMPMPGTIGTDGGGDPWISP